MRETGRNVWKLRIAAAMIFLLGAAAGLLAPRAYYAWTRGGGAQERPRGEFGRMLDRLDLTAEQRTQVQQILSDMREQFRALRRETRPREDDIRRQADERLRQVFTPGQWQQFQKLISERRPRRSRPARGDNPPPPSERR